MQKALHIFCWLIFPFTIFSQNLDDFYAEQDWRTGQFALSRTNFSGNWQNIPPPNPNNSFVFTPFSFTNKITFADLNFHIASHYKEQWKLNYDLYTPLLSDLQLLLFAMVYEIGNNKKNQNTGDGFVSGFLSGWHNIGINVFGSNRLAVRTGISISDYFYSFEYYKPTKYTDRSSGAYFTLGQYVNADLAIFKWLMLRAKYQIGYWSYLSYYKHDSWAWDWGKRNDGIKKPIFSVLTFELQTLPGIFARADFWNVFAVQDAHKLARQTFNIGYRFHLVSIGEKIKRSKK